MLCEGFAQVGDELHHLLLAVFWEVFLYVELAHGFAQEAVRIALGALPTWLALLLAREHASEEVEAGLCDLIAQIAC